MLNRSTNVELASNGLQLPEGRDFNHKINLER